MMMETATPDTERVEHFPPYIDWTAFQEGRGIIVADRNSHRVKRYCPPESWGSVWGWNFTENGLGIYFARR